MIARVVVAASGSGRSFRNLMERQREFRQYRIVGLIGSDPRCGAVELAAAENLPTYVDTFSSGAWEASTDLEGWLLELDAHWIALAGFLKLFPTEFSINRWESRIVNIHPSLLPKFGGKGMYGESVHRAVLDAGENISGASIHLVDSHYDRGRILAQTFVKVRHFDTSLSLASRVFEKECELYPQVLADLVDQKLPLQDGSIQIYTF